MTITEQPPHSSQTKANPGIGEVTMNNYDRFQCRDKNHPSRISAIKPDQIRLILQYSIDLGIGTRVTIYPTKRNSQLLTTVTSQT